jgi:Transposase DDE domain
VENLLDLYTDYLISSFGQTSATGLSRLTDNEIKHDSVTRLLSNSDFTGKTLWQTVKPLVRKHQAEDACLIFDDVIIEKAHTDENDLICWHWDHSKKRNVKGINVLNAFYHTWKAEESEPLRVPVGFETIKKTIRFCDLKTKKEKRKSDVSKNELMLQMIAKAIANGLIFKYIIADSWFASVANMRFIKQKKKIFIFDMQSNRLAVLNEPDRKTGNWTRIDELKIPNNKPVQVWLKDLEFPVLLTKQIFTNKDNSTGYRFLVSNESSLTDDQMTTIYKKRWSVEEYHKSLKQNVSIGKSPTRTEKTQTNHLYASMLGYIKLEKLKFANKLNHFAMKTKIYNQALKAAFKELCSLKSAACA